MLLNPIQMTHFQNYVYLKFGEQATIQFCEDESAVVLDETYCVIAHFDFEGDGEIVEINYSSRRPTTFYKLGNLLVCHPPMNWG